MKYNQSSAIDSHRRLTTEELAVQLAMQPQSIRKHLNQRGTYYGLQPVKLPNGKLRWPADSVEQLANGGTP
jgi:hypothetical protein